MRIQQVALFHSVIIIFFLILTACNYPKLLPAEVSSKLKQGKFLNQVWIDSSYNKKDGYLIEPIWVGKKTNEGLVAYFSSHSNKLIVQNSSNIMSIYILHDNSFPSTFSAPSIRFEGRVRNKSGKDVAAFINEITLVFPGDDPVKASIDNLLIAIQQEFN